jgi:hypothetical protein
MLTPSTFFLPDQSHDRSTTLKHFLFWNISFSFLISIKYMLFYISYPVTLIYNEPTKCFSKLWFIWVLTIALFSFFDWLWFLFWGWAFDSIVLDRWSPAWSLASILANWWSFLKGLGISRNTVETQKLSTKCDPDSKFEMNGGISQLWSPENPGSMLEFWSSSTWNMQAASPVPNPSVWM